MVTRFNYNVAIKRRRILRKTLSQNTNSRFHVVKQPISLTWRPRQRAFHIFFQNLLKKDELTALFKVNLFYLHYNVFGFRICSQDFSPGSLVFLRNAIRISKKQLKLMWLPLQIFQFWFSPTEYFELVYYRRVIRFATLQSYGEKNLKIYFFRAFPTVKLTFLS